MPVIVRRIPPADRKGPTTDLRAATTTVARTRGQPLRPQAAHPGPSGRGGPDSDPHLPSRRESASDAVVHQWLIGMAALRSRAAPPHSPRLSCEDATETPPELTLR
jgi:hypothetical protein